MIDWRYWKESLICILLSGIIFLMITLIPGCRTQMPKVDVDFWAGDSEKEGITRSQENRTLFCHDPQFDDYVCLTYRDLRKIYSVMLQCKDWGMEQQMPLEIFLSRNPAILTNSSTQP